MRLFQNTLALSAAMVVACSSAFATTKGLNQIVTPDVQPAGELSISYQQQDPSIGNPGQFQLEMGLTRQFEVAVFQGLSPGNTTLSVEYGLIQQKNWLLSTGFLNWTTTGGAPQPYLEGGYYSGANKLMAGLSRSGNQTSGILGWGIQVHPRMLVQFDYITGHGNFATVGFTYTITPSLSFNPALYISNDGSHSVVPYGVVTWNIKIF